MGKKSLTKSTTKKKAATAKKSTAKKKAGSAAPQKNAAPKAKITPKKTAAKKTPTAKKPIDLNAIEKPATAKKTAAQKAGAKKIAPEKKIIADEKRAKPAPEKKAVSIPELLKLKFDAWQPEKIYTATTDKEFQKGFSAPPAVEAPDKAEAERIKALLAKTFDLSVTETLEPPVAEAETETEEKAEAEAKTKTEKETAERAKADAEAKAKEAAEKAKAEKEAERKAKAEAEAKAKTEKKAAEKARTDAAAKQKAEKPLTPPVMPKIADPTTPPLDNPLKMLIAIIGGLFGLLIIASSMNTNNYYLKSTDNAVEIWKGKFSPTGRELVISVPDAIIEGPVKSVYTQKEALVPAFNYYIKKSEALLEVNGQIDFKTIKSDLYQAIKFAPTRLHAKMAKTRLNKIDFIFLVYKADVAAGKNTIKGCEAALKNLSKAADLGPDKNQKELLDKKTAGINDVLNNLKKNLKAKKTAKKIAAQKKLPEKTPEKTLQHEKNAAPKTTKHH